MRVLIVGGTGLISTGIVKHLLSRGADVTLFNRAYGWLKEHGMSEGQSQHAALVVG